MELWHAWTCPYCMRVRIALAEKQVAYREREVDLARKPPELLALNPPSGGVPVLVDGGRAIPESLAILRHLEERFPEPALLPREPVARARSLALYERSALLAPHLPKLLRGAPSEKEAAAAAIRAALQALEAEAPEQGWLAGTFSIADIALASLVLKLPATERPSGLGLPRLGRWEAAVSERPSVARHTAPARSDAATTP